MAHPPRVLQRAPTQIASPAPTSRLRNSGSVINHNSQPAAAVVLPAGGTVAQASLQRIAPGGSVVAPAGNRVAGFLHADGTGVQFLGEGGGVFLSTVVAQREFGPLLAAARRLLSDDAPQTAAPALQRRADSSAALSASTTVDTALAASAHHPLPASHRAPLEASYGVDLGHVQLHTDALADQAAAAVHAKAFTTGQDIFFRAGHFQPGSPTGDHLLAHEVAHAVQQGGTTGTIARMPVTTEWQVSHPADHHEAEADRAADAAMRGAHATIAPLAAPLIARAPEGAAPAVETEEPSFFGTLFKLKELASTTFAKSGEAVELILADPIAFLGNLVAGVGQGVTGFLDNLGVYLPKGLLEWLFAAVAQAGIQLPEKYDTRGVLSLVTQVLGLTYANIRQRAVGIVGEEVVGGLEKASEIFMLLATKGVAGVWEYLREQATATLNTLLESVQSFVMESVIAAGAKWLFGLLNPASALVKAALAIYDIINFITTRGQQILSLVNAVVDSILPIAKGTIAPAAKAVEGALAKSIPVTIGFFASLIGLGDLGAKMQKLIEKIQTPVNKMIDWLIKKAVSLVKAVGKKLGIRTSDDSGPSRGSELELASEPVPMMGHEHEVVVEHDGENVEIGLASIKKRPIVVLIDRLEAEIESSEDESSAERKKLLAELAGIRTRVFDAIARIKEVLDFQATAPMKQREILLRHKANREKLSNVLRDKLVGQIRVFAEENGFSDLTYPKNLSKKDESIMWDVTPTVRGLVGEAFLGANRGDKFAPRMDRDNRDGVWESHKTFDVRKKELKDIFKKGRKFIEDASSFSKTHKIKGERTPIRARHLVIICPANPSSLRETLKEVWLQLESEAAKKDPPVTLRILWI